MSSTAKWVIAIIVVILVIAGIWSYSSKPATPTGEKPTITLGISAPLSGNVAFLGVNFQKAINLAMSELSTSTNKYNYKVVFEDDQFNPSSAVTAVNKLISVDKVDALVTIGSPVGNAVNPIAEQNKIVNINSGASDPNVAKGRYNFIHWTPPYEEVKLMIAELQKKGIKKVAVFAQIDNPGIDASIKSFKENIKGTDIKIVAEENYKSGERDFRSLILKTKNSGAEIYFVEAVAPELEILAKQIRESGIKSPITSIESFEFTEQPKLFEGLWYVNAADQGAEFINKFKAVYGSLPNFGGGNGYDTINMLVYAFEKAGDGKSKPSSDQVVEALQGIKDFPGAMGTLNMGQDHIVNTKAVVRMIKNGVPTTIPE